MKRWNGENDENYENDEKKANIKKTPMSWEAAQPLHNNHNLEATRIPLPKGAKDTQFGAKHKL